MQAFISSCGLATIATVANGMVVASHVPMLFDPKTGPYGSLVGHVARPNTQWRETDSSVQALAIFRGADAYVSPAYYETTRTTGKVVPTWNYEVVHAGGPICFFEERERLLDVVVRLTERHETGIASPWHISDAPPEYIDAELRGIVGFALTIERLEGAFKLGRNRSEADRLGVISALEGSQRAGDREIAAAMRENEG
jgi:transcriptional regulator